MRVTASRSLLFTIAKTLSVVAISTPVGAQGMSFSVFTDASANSSGVITSYSSAIDNSWGCSHWQYSITASIYSPSNRLGTSGSTSGLSASAVLSINDELGNYYVTTSGNYRCSCIGGGYAGFGGGFNAVASETTSEVDYTYQSSSINQQQQLKYCNFGRCSHSPSDCGSGFQDVIGIAQQCAPGIRSTWLVKRFLGITYRCEEIYHAHHSSAPC